MTENGFFGFLDQGAGSAGKIGALFGLDPNEDAREDANKLTQQSNRNTRIATELEAKTMAGWQKVALWVGVAVAAAVILFAVFRRRNG